MSELNERLEKLATRGTRRGADAVLAAAAERATPAERRNGQGESDAGSPRLATSDLEVIAPHDGPEPPMVTMEEARLRRTRRPWRTAITAGGLAALLGVGTLGIASLMADGGADSAEGAVRQLADAISHEDPLAAIDVLAPEEVAGLRSAVDSVTQRAQELKLVDDAAAPLAGVDLSVDDLDLSSQELAPGYSKVTITNGRMSGEASRDGLSPMLQRAWGRDDRTTRRAEVEPADFTTDEGVEPFIVVVQRDGGWYVSPAYTALEYLHVVEGGPTPDYGGGLTGAPGAPSPEQAARDALDAFAAGNWNRLWELSAPAEVPLYDYRGTLDQALADTEAPGFTIDDFTAVADVAGDRATITVRASGRDADGGTWSLDDRCVGWAGAEHAVSIDGSGSGDEMLGGAFCPGGSSAGLYGLWTDGAANTEGVRPILRFTAVRDRDRWFLSPIGTVVDVFEQAVRGFDERSVASLLGLEGELPPDGALTLGQPTAVQNAVAGLAYVFTFEGRAGQEVAAVVEALAGKTPYWPAGYVTIIDAEGNRLDSQYGPTYDIETAILPADGTYRAVVRPKDGGEFTFTLYDIENAPADVLDPPDPCAAADAPPECGSFDESGSCSFDPQTGVESCTSTGSGSATPPATTATELGASTDSGVAPASPTSVAG